MGQLYFSVLLLLLLKLSYLRAHPLSLDRSFLRSAPFHVNPRKRASPHAPFSAFLGGLDGRSAADGSGGGAPVVSSALSAQLRGLRARSSSSSSPAGLPHFNAGVAARRRWWRRRGEAPDTGGGGVSGVSTFEKRTLMNITPAEYEIISLLNPHARGC